MTSLRRMVVRLFSRAEDRSRARVDRVVKRSRQFRQTARPGVDKAKAVADAYAAADDALR
jgi:hypothetical protein